MWRCAERITWNEPRLLDRLALFRQWLKICRIRVRISEQEVSDKLGLAPGLLKSYEEGEDIPMGVLLSLMELYQVDTTVLSAKLSALT